jgi:DNA polymerase sigma
MPLLKARIAGGIELKLTLSPLEVAEIPACQTAEIVSKTFKELPHARKLLLITKALMRAPNCLHAFVGVHTGGVSSYTVTLMVLAFCKFQV